MEKQTDKEQLLLQCIVSWAYMDDLLLKGNETTI